GFCELPDSWSASSSIMPQKKNPDAAELLRAKAPRVVGHLAALHGVMHALPLTYNKDLQEDKEHLFDAVDTLALTLAAAAGMIAGVAFDRERLREAGGGVARGGGRRARGGNRRRRSARAPGRALPGGSRRGRGPRAHGRGQRPARVGALRRGAGPPQRDARRPPRRAGGGAHAALV